VVAGQQVEDNRFQGRWETGDVVDGASYSGDFHDDMAEEIAFHGVADGTFVSELFEFADVVENGGC
jgi:hypothetical protein